MLRSTKKRARRRAWPIHGYVGPNGSGKSAAMVWDTMASLDLGRPVLSTVRLLDYDNPRVCDDAECPDVEGHARGHMAAHPLYVPFTDWGQLLDGFTPPALADAGDPDDEDYPIRDGLWFRRLDVLMDEVTGVASSRESQSMPAPVANALVQLRRRDIIVRWSSPSWDRADKIIRQCSQAVTHCQGYMPVEDGDTDRLWRRRRLFKWKTYDAQLFEDFTNGKREQSAPDLVNWYWGPGSPVFGAYDTYDAVLAIGSVTEGGSCYRCGGSRPRPKCKCPDHGAPEAGGAQGVGAPRSAEREEAPALVGPGTGKRRLESVLG